MEGEILHEILGSEHGKRDKTSEAEKRGLLGEDFGVWGQEFGHK